MWDPTVIAAIITGAANIGKSIFERWSGASKNVDKRLDQFVEGEYDKLRRYLTDPSVSILKKAEDGQNHVLRDLRNFAYPNLSFSSPQEESQYDKQFDYRLRFLQLVGVLTQAVGDYYITPIGMAFLREARKRK